MPLVAELGLVLLLMGAVACVLFDEVSTTVGRLLRRPLVWWLTGGVVLFLAVFTVIASLIFLSWTGLSGAFPHPYWQWWLYLYEYGGDSNIRVWLIISGIPAALLAVIAAAVLFLRRRLVRGWTLRRLRIAAGAIWALAAWGVLASLIALLLAGHLWWFGRWWWWDFLPYAGSPGVLRVLAESASFAAAIVGLVLGIGLVSSGDLRRRADQPLYGKTEWASRAELERGGFRETQGPQ